MMGLRRGGASDRHRRHHPNRTSSPDVHALFERGFLQIGERPRNVTTSTTPSIECNAMVYTYGGSAPARASLRFQ